MEQEEKTVSERQEIKEPTVLVEELEIGDFVHSSRTDRKHQLKNTFTCTLTEKLGCVWYQPFR